MPSLLFVILAFAVVLAASRKLQLGYSLLLGAILLGLLSRMNWSDFGQSLQTALVNWKTLNFLFLIFLVLVLSQALKSTGQLERLVEASSNILHDLRLTVFFLPALIGMLPMPGGAYFSAPMVGTVLKKTSLSPEKKVFANYWFRHIWEYILPIYPGIVALVSLTGLDFGKVIGVNILLTLTAIAGGILIVFGKGGFPLEKRRYRGDFKSFGKFLREISPVFLVLILAISFELPGKWGMWQITGALGLGIISVFIMNRCKWQIILDTFKKGLSWKMFMMIIGIVIFKGILSDCGAVTDIASFMEQNKFGAAPIIFGVSFLSGLVTGITIGFVGISLPIVLSIIEQPTPWNMMFVFACGFGGVLLSPVHLCLVMTNQYFKANLSGVYRYLIPATLLVMAVGFIGYFM